MTDPSDDALLDEIERWAFTYFLHEADDQTGLIRDNTAPTAPATIAGSGFALTCYAVGAERAYIPRAEAAERVACALRFLWEELGGEDERTGMGAHGLYYHFLDPGTGHRVWGCELSTMDTAIALAGVLAAGTYFDADAPTERAIRSLADAIYQRVDWVWAMGGRSRIALGWSPEFGFSPYGWGGYSEALLLYVLGLGSPSHPLPPECYAAWTETYRWTRCYGFEYLYAGPLFIHQLSHCWIDFRGIQDEFMAARGIDYFENSRRATYVQQEYARRNPRGWAAYAANCWGVTASDGPGPALGEWNGHRQQYFNYHARGVPHGPDDGTISPWAVVASVPFAPEIAVPAIRAIDQQYPDVKHGYGYVGSFNASFVGAGTRGRDANPARGAGWVSSLHYAINQGPVVLMVENYRSGFVWRLMQRCRYLVNGLERAGFRGGWLLNPRP